MDKMIIRLKTVILAIVVSFIIVLLLISCDKSSDIESVKATIRRETRAIIEKNKTEFLKCYPNTSDYQYVAGLYYDLFLLQVEFLDTLIEHYGPDAWEEFKSISLDTGSIVITPPPTKNLDVFMESVQITMQGDKAFAHSDVGYLCNTELKKYNGEWKIIGDSTPPREYFDEVKYVIQAHQEAIRDISKPGVTLTQIKQNMSMIILTNNAGFPKELIRNLYESLVQKNKEQFLASYPNTPEYQRIANLEYEYGLLQIELRDYLLKHFGKNGWYEFQKFIFETHLADYNPPPVNIRDFIMWSVEYVEYEDDIVILGLDDDYPNYYGWTLKKYDGKWRIVLDEEEKTLEKRFHDLELLIKAYRQAHNKIGKPGVSVGNLKKNMSRVLKMD